jgi:hypothetical protein
LTFYEADTAAKKLAIALYLNESKKGRFSQENLTVSENGSWQQLANKRREDLGSVQFNLDGKR